MLQVTATTPLWTASRVMVGSRCEELLSCWKRADKTFSPEDIHDLRVASRRLREAITLFAPCFPAKKFSYIKVETKRLTNLLGVMRNTDEALLFFTPLLSSIPGPLATSLDSWLQSMRIKRTREHRNIANRLKKMNLTLLKYELQSALRHPYLFVSAAYDPFMPVSRFFTVKLLERETVLQQLLPDSLCEKNITALHRLRIALKKFRYAFELTAPLITDGYRDLHAVIKEYQELLGKIHDLDVFLELIQNHAFEPDCSDHLTALITGQRKALHAAFLTLHATHPVDKLGESARELL